MIDWQMRIWGVRLFYWMYLPLSLLILGVVIAYWQREKLLKVWYSLRFPERLIKVNIIYPGNYIRHFWRLIPKTNTFDFGEETYQYSEPSILKQNDWYATKKEDGRLILRIKDNEYYLDDLLGIKNRWDQWPEIYYIDGCPFPVDWGKTAAPEITATNEKGEQTTKKVHFNATDYKKFKQTKIITDLFASMENSGLMLALVILAVLILILVGVGLMNDAGIIHLAKEGVNATVVK